MAGWSKVVDGTSVGGFNKLQEVQTTEPYSKMSGDIDENDEKNSDKKLKCLFNDFLEVFLQQVSGSSSYKPLHPVIFDGQEVDLFKLYSIVRDRGGYKSVSQNGSWGLVAEKCGFMFSTGSSLKLVYFKYLDTLDRWLMKSVKAKQEEKTELRERDLGFCGISMDLKSDLKVFLLGIMDKKKEDWEFVNVETRTNSIGFEGRENQLKDRGFVESNGRAEVFDENRRVKDGQEIINEKLDIKKIVNNDNKCSGDSNKKRGGVEAGNDIDVKTNSPVIGENSAGKKRKLGCYSSMLDWISKVAKDPCNPAIGFLPERHKWKNYGSEHAWKQILLVREEMHLKRDLNSTSQQSIWQKKQKMHPSMYDDQNASERLRSSQRLHYVKDSSSKAQKQIGSEMSSYGSQSDEDRSDRQPDSTAYSIGFLSNSYHSKRIPIGPLFQADVPELCGEAYAGDSKWVGTQIWPLRKGEVTKSLIERDRIGKGRQESCGCQFPGSVECVRFHISEKRMRVKLELGPAFYRWKFDSVGEEVALSWTKDEQNKFQNIVKLIIASPDKYFWDELFKFFPRKGRESLVSYYYDVFLLQRRGYQNRNSTSTIDSDDEESEFGPLHNRFGQTAAKSPVSIFPSP